MEDPEDYFTTLVKWKYYGNFSARG